MEGSGGETGVTGVPIQRGCLKVGRWRLNFWICSVDFLYLFLFHRPCFLHQSSFGGVWRNSIISLPIEGILQPCELFLSMERRFGERDIT